VAPDPKQKIPTAEMRDQTNLSFEYPYLKAINNKVIEMLYPPKYLSQAHHIHIMQTVHLENRNMKTIKSHSFKS
jgi:hypothetical protein